MGGRELTLWTVASMFGKHLPEPGKRGYCVLREHRRKDKSLTVFRSKGGDLLYKCHSCDPPDNIGDALALYAVLEGIDRKTAWHQLRERGYAVPGDDGGSRRQPQRPKPKPKPVPVTGRSAPGSPLELSRERWQQLRQQRLGAVEQLAASRGLDPKLLRASDVVDADRGVVGFGYREPFSGHPCRVKFRPLARKTFWIEPRPGQGQEGKALGPLYLADRLQIEPGRAGVAIITEGELDALSLRQCAISNAVSLPDGALSAGHVDLKPLSCGYPLWLAATDRDTEGELAFRVLRSRARAIGITVVKLWFQLGGQQFKDANEALQGGMGQAEFTELINAECSRALGYEVNVA